MSLLLPLSLVRASPLTRTQTATAGNTYGAFSLPTCRSPTSFQLTTAVGQRENVRLYYEVLLKETREEEMRAFFESKGLVPPPMHLGPPPGFPPRLPPPGFPLAAVPPPSLAAFVPPPSLAAFVPPAALPKLA